VLAFGWQLLEHGRDVAPGGDAGADAHRDRAETRLAARR
jgi:hypothetical protein